MRILNSLFFCFLLLSAPLVAQENKLDFREVVKEAIPAVVYIETESMAKSAGPMGPMPPEIYNDPFWRHFFHMPQQEGQSRPQMGLGSGFLISQDGYIMTNNHVVDNADKIKVTLQDKREFDAELVGADPNTDLAIIKIAGEAFPYMEFGDSDELEVGEWVAAMGSPLGLQATVTVGVVSAKGRSNLQLTNFEDFIQTDAAINRGNSGGALVNLEGKVVGINTALASNTGGYMGIGFAIPSNMARQIQRQLIDNGQVTRGFLGIGLQEVTQELADAFDLKRIQGALVTEVVPDSAAEKGGLKPGDLILSFNGKEVLAADRLRNAVALMPPGSDLSLGILREGENLSIDLTVGEHPQNKGAVAKASNPLGIQVERITTEMREKLALSQGEEGVMVSDVAKGSLGQKAGLGKGTVILGVNMQPVYAPEEFYGLLNEGMTQKNRVILLVKQGYRTRFISIRL